MQINLLNEIATKLPIMAPISVPINVIYLLFTSLEFVHDFWFKNQSKSVIFLSAREVGVSVTAREIIHSILIVTPSFPTSSYNFNHSDTSYCMRAIHAIPFLLPCMVVI